MDSTTQANISLEKGTEQTQSNCSVGSTEGMVFVQGGTFQMGSNEYEDEKPIHSVTISDFYIGKYEVTQKEWKEVMGANPSIWKGDNLPVEQVSWYEEGCLY
ncbi:MAG: formylglycine-generating enzyme family protein [Candidatus Cloacimonetes bacterium]|nr:formylglycine-generating enzyme family protein [Candidatus Cloacimonadota bacterium]